jgi:hypothetical protein
MDAQAFWDAHKDIWQSGTMREFVDAWCKAGDDLFAVLMAMDDFTVQYGIIGDIVTAFAEPVLRFLITHPNPGVRLEAAHHPQIPVDALISMKHDDFVRGGLAANPSTPVEILRELLADKYLWGSLSHNPKLPPDMLHELAHSPDHDIRRSVARNPNTSVETIAMLKDDIVERVREAASRRQ